MNFLHRDLPMFQRGLQLGLAQRLTQVIVHPCGETLLAFSLQGVSRQGDDVDRRLPRAQWTQARFPLAGVSLACPSSMETGLFGSPAQMTVLITSGRNQSA